MISKRRGEPRHNLPGGIMDFRTQYLDYFKRIAHHLGEGWRVVTLPTESVYSITLTNPELRHFMISAKRAENSRLHISSGVNQDRHFYSKHWCTVSPDRSPAHVARDIKRKLLEHAFKENAEEVERRSKREGNSEATAILLAALGRLVEVDDDTRHSGTFCNFVHKGAGIKGKIEGKLEWGNFDLRLSALPPEKLVKIMGFLTTL